MERSCARDPKVDISVVGISPRQPQQVTTTLTTKTQTNTEERLKKKQKKKRKTKQQIDTQSNDLRKPQIPLFVRTSFSQADKEGGDFTTRA